jgi:ketosteroid isomerase-like protein
MSQETVELARQCFDAWSSWVFEDIAAFYARDAEIISPSSEMFGRTYRGHEGLRLYIDHFVAAFEPPSFELEEIVDAGERVITVAVCRTRGSESGVAVSQRTATVCTIRDGLIRREVIYLNRNDALESVGLSE